MAIVPSKIEASFDEQFAVQTRPDPGISSVPRREALRGLVLKANVARGAIDALGDQLDGNERNPAWLIDRVVTVASEHYSLRESELILIAAETDSPEKAATIANAWAAAYVREVNSLYARIPDETVALMQKKAAEAQRVYDDAQRKVEAFIANNEITWLEQQIKQQHLVLEERTKVLSALQNERLRLDRVLTSTHSLRTQIEAAAAAGGANASNNMVILLLKTEVFVPSLSNLEFKLDGIGTLEASPVELAIEIDALLRTLQDEIVQIDRKIWRLLYEDGSDLVAGTPTTSGPSLHLPGETERILQWLHERKEVVGAERRQLIAERDRRWRALVALNDAQTGLELASDSVVSEVRLAAPAVPPIKPTGRMNRTWVAIVWGALGLLTGIVLALGANFLGVRPFLRKRV